MPPKVAQMIKEQEEQKIFKELEKLGYEINNTDEELLLLYSEKNNNHIFIDKYQKKYSSMEEITFQTHQLLHRLFEIWGWLK